MDTKQQTPVARPSLDLIEKELARLKHKKSFSKAIFDTLAALTVIAAIAVLLSTMLVPVFRVYGGSMAPTLNEGEIIFSVKTNNINSGDIVAFYYNNKVLIKRVIAKAGDWVELTEDNKVIVNDIEIEEPYATGENLVVSDIAMPYQVPDGRWFVMGDQRDISVDSRSTMVGPISHEQVIGKVTFRIWPLDSFGLIR